MALVLAALLAIAGCGGGSVATGPVTTSPAGSAPTGATPGRTAADDLAPYFNAAQSMDRQLAAAAVLVNGGIHAGTMQFDQATLAAITAIQPRTLGAKIPPGLPPELERRVLLMDSELVSRRAAFNEVLRGTAGSAYVVRCLANGAPAAARFASDLAAARSLATQTPPVAAQPHDSRAAADLAITLQYIEGVNTCCGSCGGVLLTQLPRISWAPTQGWDGTITVAVPSRRWS